MSATEASRVRFGKTDIEYRVRRSPRRRTVGISVDPARGVLVAAPPDVPLARLDSVVHRKAVWIVGRLRAVGRTAPRLTPREFVSGESYLYLGRSYRLKLTPQAEPSEARLVGGWIQVGVEKTGGGSTRASAVRSALESWYRAHAAERLTERVQRPAPRVVGSVPKILLREQPKRWGSCDARGALRFNWRIIQAPMRLVDYVVAHELVHLVEKNHTRAFWALLGKVMPDYERRREELRVLGPRLLW